MAGSPAASCAPRTRTAPRRWGSASTRRSGLVSASIPRPATDRWAESPCRYWADRGKTTTPIIRRGEIMPRSLAAAVLALAAVLPAWAAGPTVTFTLPAENTTPGTFGALPWPDDLYFDQGRPGDGDGTLLNSGASIGLGADVIEMNTATVEQALDLMDGFGTTSAIYFFLSGPIDPATLPLSPRTAPSLGDSVFCADAATGTPVPIGLRWDVDTRIP